MLNKKSRTGSKTTSKVSTRLVYSFGNGKAEGNESMKEMLGGKGANLHGMTSLGLPVPAGFTISTEVCAYFYSNNKSYPKHLEGQVKKALAQMEKQMGARLGDKKNPLLVSVRSGAPVSMPGMMDTILNLGLNDETVEALVRKSNDARFSYDSYRRFIQMYSDVVLGIHSNLFEMALEEQRDAAGVENDTDLSAEDLKRLIVRYKTIVATEGRKFPMDPYEQLWGAIGAVFDSWQSARAITYRRLNSIPDHWGTAVNVQAMVFGNMGNDCATGVAFTRDPSTGERKFFGEFLCNAQGEDVVAGIRTPHPINESSRMEAGSVGATLEKTMPQAYGQLVKTYKRLEKHYRDMQDIEFTIQQNRLYMLQTRSGKRTAAAALRIAVEMVQEKLISKQEAVLRIDPQQLETLLHPMLDPNAKKQVIAKGLPASPGAASGQVVFDPDVAEDWRAEGKKVILVRIETSPEDINGMSAAQGILTARGGMTSHAAVVARGMGKCCVSGCSAMSVDYANRRFTVGGKSFKEGDFITLDGGTGEVILGEVPTIQPGMNQDFRILMQWVDEYKDMAVRTNADTPHDAAVARKFGAEGIGLCRTEHMFFDAERIDAVREMILAEHDDGRRAALSKILPMQRSDFKGLFEAMADLPVTIRLLDPPLHEFIPQTEEEMKALAERIDAPFEKLERKAETLKEFNPMLGHRGCRLGISFPEIYRTQVRAIMEAVCEVYKEKKKKIVPEIMIPLVGHWKELEFVRNFVEDEIQKVLAEQGAGKRLPIEYLIGTMIELPRAALTAAEIAEYADFYSFGTNDLTQTTFGLSRDDAGVVIKDYVDHKIYSRDPFASLDESGVGRLVEIAFQEGRKAKPSLKLGICGEHGGDPESVNLCHRIGLDYVSCSPFRVPVARLAAAQAALRAGQSKRKSNKKNSKTAARPKKKKNRRA